jgi:hypothetical protein
MPNLTDSDVQDTRSSEKPKRLYDSGGLFLLVTPKGGRWWRFKYRFEGRAKMISLGTFPRVSLAHARALRDNARLILKQGIDPSTIRKSEKAQEKTEKDREKARMKAEGEQSEGVAMPSVRFLMDGTIELWKGVNVMRFSPDEARFVAELLSALKGR